MNSDGLRTKIMASGPIPSWQIDGETMKAVTKFHLNLMFFATHVELLATLSNFHGPVLSSLVMSDSLQPHGL